MAKSIDVSDLNIYYGDFLAVEGVNMTVKSKSVTAFIGRARRGAVNPGTLSCPFRGGRR